MSPYWRLPSKGWPIIALVIVLALGFAVWPSPYRYEHSGSELVRINRITGKTWQYLGKGIWQSGDDFEGLTPADPNAVDTGAAMAPAPAAMDTGMIMIDSQAMRDSIARRDSLKRRR